MDRDETGKPFLCSGKITIKKARAGVAKRLIRIRWSRPNGACPVIIGTRFAGCYALIAGLRCRRQIIALQAQGAGRCRTRLGMGVGRIGDRQSVTRFPRHQALHGGIEPVNFLPQATVFKG